MAQCSLILKTAAVLLALTASAAGQDYPNKPVRIIVPFAPGAANDLIGRIVATQLSERLGKQFVVENRAGAGGIIAGEIVTNAPKDGHTLMLVSSAITQNPHLFKMPYDHLKAYAPVAILGTAPNVLAINKDLPVQSLKICWRSPRRSRATCAMPRPGSARSCILAQSCLSRWRASTSRTCRFVAAPPR